MQKTQPKINHTDRKFAEIRHLWGEDGEEEEKPRQTQQNKKHQRRCNNNKNCKKNEARHKIYCAEQ